MSRGLPHVRRRPKLLELTYLQCSDDRPDLVRRNVFVKKGPASFSMNETLVFGVINDIRRQNGELNRLAWLG